MKHTENNKPVRKRKTDFFRFFTILLAVLLAVEVAAGAGGLIFVKSITRYEPSLDVDELYSQESTRIFDKDGNELTNVGNAIRENVKYNDIPESLIDAFLAVEDSRFFTHNGFDVSRFAAAALTNLRSGSTAQGGSTFTMQLVKLTYFFTDDDDNTNDAERNVAYKVQQIDMALKLEKQAGKKEIFELYLNKMNFGGQGNIRGVEKASEYYFNKRVSQLNLSESALLAGIINSPYYYDPFNYLDYSTERRNQVLDMMLRHGYVTQNEYDLAKSVKVEDLLYDHSQDDVEEIDPNQAYIDQVLVEAQQITGQDPYTIAMDIQTAMDPDIQNLSYQICAGNVSSVVYPNDAMEIGFVTENNQTGEIIAIGGGRNYAAGGSSLLNHGTAVYHDPGSSVKPFLSYVLAFENLGWATSHVVCDEPVGDSSWVYQNANGTYAGDVTLEYAYQVSLNTPALQAMYSEIDEMGKKKIIAYMDKLNFSHLDDDSFNVGWAIGANGFTASPEEIAAAHSMLLNSGQYIKPHCITEITYRSGHQEPITVSELDDYQPVQVLSEEAAWLTSYMMSRVPYAPVENFTRLLQRSYQTFVKTGTSDWGSSGVQYGIPEGASKDHWQVCSTSEYTTAVWSGFDKAETGKQTWLTQSTLMANTTGNINNEILNALYADHSPADYEKPDSISQITHIKGVFPYVKPIDGMSDQYITTGYIKKKNASLAEPEGADSVAELSDFSAEMEDDNKAVSFTWAAYPDSSKLSVAGTTKDISLYSGSTLLAAATGNRMFDYSWVYGPIQYKATISQNGEVVDTVASSSETLTQDIDAMEPETETEVCGYYGYENLESSSNQVCSTFTTPERKYTLPLQGTYEQIKEWLKENGLSVSQISEEHTNGSGSVGSVTIYIDGSDVTSEPLTRDSYASAHIVIIAD